MENVGLCFPKHLYQNCLLGLFKGQSLKLGNNPDVLPGLSWWAVARPHQGHTQLWKERATDTGNHLGEAQWHYSEGKKTVSQVASCAIPNSRRKKWWWQRKDWCSPGGCGGESVDIARVSLLGWWDSSVPRLWWSHRSTICVKFTTSSRVKKKLTKSLYVAHLRLKNQNLGRWSWASEVFLTSSQRSSWTPSIELSWLS